MMRAEEVLQRGVRAVGAGIILGGVLAAVWFAALAWGQVLSF